MKGNLLTTIQEGLGGSNNTKGISADVVDEHSARIDLSIIMEYGKSATDVFEQFKEVIGKDLDDMTSLHITEMTVRVVDVMTQEEFDQRRGSAGNNDSNQSANA